MNKNELLPTEIDGVVLQEMTVDDAADYFAAVEYDRSHLSQYGDPTAANYLSLREVEESLRYNRPERVRYSIREAGVYAGTVNADAEPRNGLEIGYWLDSRFTGRGLATVAVRALTSQLVRTGLPVFGIVHPDNLASAAVLKRAGFLMAHSESSDFYHKYVHAPMHGPQLPEVTDSLPDISFADYRQTLVPMSDYLRADDPELVIRSGLIEETAEVLDTRPADHKEMTKEIGDVLFYLDAAASLRHLTLDEVTGAATLASFQSAVVGGEYRKLPFNRVASESFRGPVNLNLQQELALRMLRVVDTLNPKTEELWAGYEARPPASLVIRDALVCLSELADAQYVRLHVAARQAVDKVLGRERKPHVVDRMSMLMSSQRERIMTRDPIVSRMLGASVTQQRPQFSNRFRGH